MINAPQGMATSLPAAPAATSCSSTPPALVGGGISAPTMAAVLPAAPSTSAFGAPAVPTTGASMATLGSSSIASSLYAGGSGFTSGFGGYFGAPQGPTVVPLPAPVPGVNSPVLNTNQPIPAATSATMAATPGSAATTGGGTLAPSRPLTTLAPGGNAGDAALVEQTLGILRRSASGSQIVDRLLAVGARVNVISDAEFQSMGHQEAHAFYDPKIDTMFLRRSDLSNTQDMGMAAIALAHEGTHLLDDVAGLSEPFTEQVSQRVLAAGGLATAEGAAIRDQALFELTMMKESRAFLFAGQVARELGLQLPANDPTSTAIAGANDQATYEAVWNRLLQSSYNEAGRTATPRNL